MLPVMHVSEQIIFAYRVYIQQPVSTNVQLFDIFT